MYYNRSKYYLIDYFSSLPIILLVFQISATMSDLNKLSDEYKFVSNKTNALHTMSEQLLADQNKLSGIGKATVLLNNEMT